MHRREFLIRSTSALGATWLKYALSLGVLDAFTIGAENKPHQEDLIHRIAAE